MADVIGFDPVAWSIDGGRHPGSLLRLLAYAATSGERGVVQPDDCKVTQLSTAGPQVAIGTGAVVVNVGDPATTSQTYIANASAQSRLDVTPTLGAARSDLVIARIYDPEFTSENAPPTEGQEPDWQYVVPEIIEGVPSGTTSVEDLDLPWSATELARIDLPPNTTNITSAMIKDMRRISRPRSLVDQQTVTHTAGYLQELTSTSMAAWATSATRNVAIPKWAKKVVVEVFFGGVKENSGNRWGTLRVRLGDSSSQYSQVSKEIGYDVNTTEISNAYDRKSYFIADTLTIPDQLRGTTQQFRIEGKRIGGTGTIAIDDQTSIATKLTFMETIA